jgi:hypothetical protein
MSDEQLLWLVTAMRCTGQMVVCALEMLRGRLPGRNDTDAVQQRRSVAETQKKALHE